jgi:FlaA1/EpsC-like NDP-sugar epimerase
MIYSFLDRLRAYLTRKYIRRFVRWAGVDLVLVVGAYSLAYLIRTGVAPQEYLASLQFILLAALITLLILTLSRVYHRIWAQTSGHGVTIIVKAMALTTLVVGFANYVLQPQPLPVSTIIMGNLLALVALVGIRYRSRLISGLFWRWRVIWHKEFPQADTRVLIVGAGEAGQMLAMRLQHRINSDKGYTVIGFIDDNPEKQNMYVESRPVLGVRHDIPTLVEQHDIDLIIVAIHNISGPAFREILTYCENSQALIKVMPDTLALLNSHRSTTFLRDVGPEDLLGRSVITRHEAVDLSPVMGRVILVTGAAGSIGAELSKQLASYEPTRLILVDNNESSLHDTVTSLEGRFPEVCFEPVLADITIASMLEEVFDRYHPEIVFHAAAYKHVPMLEKYPAEALRVNVGGTRSLAELSCRYSVERFVLISTDKAVHPSSVMGASKRLCELIIHALSQRDDHSTLFTAVRFGNVLGSRGSVVPTFNQQIDKGGPVTITHPDMTRYFMSIPEAVNLVIHAACLTRGDDIFVLRMGEVVRIVDLAERMIRMRGLRPNEDIKINFVGARPGEKLNEELFDECEQPQGTAHPHIIKLNTWDNGFDSAAFLTQLDQLAATGLNGHGSALEQLVEIMDSDYNRITSMD